MLAGLTAQLAELGVEAHTDATAPMRGVHRGTLRLARGTSMQTYTLRYGDKVPLTAAVGTDDGDPPFVFTTYVAGKTDDAFRRAGIQYLDKAGNAWIEFGDVLIDVQGRRRPVATTRMRLRPSNLFSAARAQVVFALLAWPQLWDAPQRTTAHAAGVSVGQVNDTLKLLKHSGYSRRDGGPGQADLLDLWAAAFPAGLAQRLTLARYASSGPINWDKLESATASGAAAVPQLLRSPNAVLYLDELNARLPIVHKWRSDGEPNITVRRRFWHDPQHGADARIAPWPLVYADLLAGEDPREREAAIEWKERHARPDQHA